MDNVKGVLLILTLLLAATTFIFFLQSRSLGTQVEEARILGEASMDYLRVQRIRCSADPQQFRKIAECMLPLLTTDDFKEDSFRQTDEKREITGYLVIENTARKVYDSEDLVFYMNRARIAEGCSVPGEIGNGVTCRFDLPQRCEAGDVLEVYHEDARLFLRTC